VEIARAESNRCHAHQRWQRQEETIAYQIIPGASHGLTIEQPDAGNRALLSFLG
jgi:pimeloyl-ACP methyl ester carboxylesterase